LIKETNYDKCTDKPTRIALKGPYISQHSSGVLTKICWHWVCYKNTTHLIIKMT